MEKNLSLEEAVRIHRNMWRFIQKVEERRGYKLVHHREILKEQFCKLFGLELSCNCAFCEFDSQYATNCSHCPGLWDYSNPGRLGACMGFEINYKTSDAGEIANIPIREDVE